jgi:hypothetical protein
MRPWPGLGTAEQRFVVLNEFDDVVFTAVEQRWLALAS